MGISAIESLPDISYIDNLTLEDVKNMLMEEYQKEYKEMTGQEVILERSDPIRILLMAQAVLDMQTLSYIDKGGKMNHLKYAYGDYMDYMGVFKNRPRNLARQARVLVRFTLAEAREEVEPIPQGTLVTADQKIFFATEEYAEIPIGETSVEVSCIATTAGLDGNKYAAGEIATLVTPTGFIAGVSNVTKSSGGADEESDEEYAEGIYNAPDKYSVAGPDDAWVALVKDFNSEVEDVRPDTVPGSGIATITVLMEGGRLPDEKELSDIKSHLMQPSINTLCTAVNVQAPNQTSYDINVTYYIGDSNKNRVTEICTAAELAIQSYISWQGSKIGRDINPDELLVLLKSVGVKRAVITEPVFSQVSESAVATFSGTQSVIYGGVESD